LECSDIVVFFCFSF